MGVRISRYLVLQTRRAALELHICPGKYLETQVHTRSQFKSLVFLEIISGGMAGTNKRRSQTENIL